MLFLSLSVNLPFSQLPVLPDRGNQLFPPFCPEGCSAWTWFRLTTDKAKQDIPKIRLKMQRKRLLNTHRYHFCNLVYNALFPIQVSTRLIPGILTKALHCTARSWKRVSLPPPIQSRAQSFSRSLSAVGRLATNRWQESLESLGLRLPGTNVCPPPVRPAHIATIFKCSH